MKYIHEDILLLAKEVKNLELEKNKILITGATGLIGALITKGFLQANTDYECKNKIFAVCRSVEKANKVFSDFLGREDLEIIEQDITEPYCSELAVDYIIHTANPTASAYFISNPVETMDAIYQGSKNVLDFAKKTRVKGVVYLSSMEVFGVVDNKDDRISEKELGYLDIGNIRSCYSEGKRLVECMCKCYAEEYEVPVKIARLAQVFGAGVSKDENRVFAQFARSAVQGKNIVLHTKGDSIGNYCYTRDAIKAILLLLKHGEYGEAYTIVNELSTMSIADMANLVAKQFSDGKSEVIFDIPEGNKFGYAPVTKMRLSNEKIRSLGWTPEVGMVEAYQRMIPDLLGD